jgi:hypothetical protein
MSLEKAIGSRDEARRREGAPDAPRRQSSPPLLAVPRQPVQPMAPPTPIPARRMGEAVARSRALRRVAAFARGDVLALFAGTRLGFLVLTYLGVVLIHDARIFGTPRVSFPLPLMDHWFHWDSMWYIQIARHGYAWSGWGTQSPTAHFPLFSLLIRDFSLATFLPDKVVAMLLSNGCFMLALLVLYRLCRREFGDEKLARRTVLYLTIFPTAFFFFAPYSESLFLLLEVAAFDALRRGRWWYAGLWGALAAVTRAPGILLALPFCWEYVAQHRRHAGGAPPVPTPVWRRIAARAGVLGLALIPAALGAYMLALQRITGDPLAFVHHAADWQRAPTWPWQTLADSVAALRAAPPDSFFAAHNMIELTGVALFVVLIVGGLRVLPPSFSLYCAAYLLFVLATPTQTSLPLTSVSRYLVVLFPAFIVLSGAGRRPLIHNLYVGIAPALLALFAVIYLNGGWVA